MLTYSQAVEYDRCFTQIDYFENCVYSDENLQATFRSAIAERDRLALLVCHIDSYQLYIDLRGLDKVANLHTNNVLLTSFCVSFSRLSRLQQTGICGSFRPFYMPLEPPRMLASTVHLKQAVLASRTLEDERN